MILKEQFTTICQLNKFLRKEKINKEDIISICHTELSMDNIEYIKLYIWQEDEVKEDEG